MGMDYNHSPGLCRGLQTGRVVNFSHGRMLHGRALASKCDTALSYRCLHGAIMPAGEWLAMPDVRDMRSRPSSGV